MPWGVISDYAYVIEVPLDGNLNTSWIAGAFAEITGYDPEEFRAQGGWRSIFFADDLPIAISRQQRLMSGQDDISEFRVVTKSGDICWLRDYGRPIWDEQQQRVTHIYGAAQNITQQKAMEVALRDSEHKYRSLAENTADGLLIWSALKKQVLYTSPGYDRQLGFKPGEGVTLTEDDVYEMLHPDDRDTMFTQLRKATDLRLRNAEYTVRRQHRDGHYIWQENHATLE